MADTRRLLSALQALLADNTAGDISAQDVRDFLVSGRMLLEEHTASASASLDFTNWYSTLYDEYLIEIVGVQPATDNVNFQLLLSTNGGSSYDSGSNYRKMTNYINSAGTTSGSAGSNTATSVALADGLDNASTGSLSATLRLFHPGSSTQYKPLLGQVVMYNNDTNYFLVNEGWFYAVATAVDAFQVKFSSGNIAAGTVRVYGV